MVQGMEALGMYTGNIPWSQIFFWVKVGVLFIIFLAIVGLIAFITTFKYKVTILRRGGSGTSEDPFYISHIGKDRCRPIRHKGVDKWKFLFKKRTIPPVDLSCVYPGNTVFLMQVSANAYIPQSIKVAKDHLDFDPLDTDVAFWTGLELKEIANDYNSQSFWEKYGSYVITLGTIFLVLVFVGVVLYMLFGKMDNLTAVLDRNLIQAATANQVPSIVPGGG